MFVTVACVTHVSVRAFNAVANAAEMVTRERFIDSFRSIGVPETVAAAVFDYYSSRGVWKDFPFSPDDSYAKVLYDDQGTMEDDTRALVDRLGMQYPAEDVLRESGNMPPQTLRDMVLLLYWIQRHQPSRP